MQHKQAAFAGNVNIQEHKTRCPSQLRNSYYILSRCAPPPQELPTLLVLKYENSYENQNIGKYGEQSRAESL